MRPESLPRATLLLPLLLAGCQPDYTAQLSCDGPAQPATPSSAYAGSTIADLEAKASTGDLAAARVLGERYEHGTGVPVDLGKAASWYQRAAIIPPGTLPVWMPGYGSVPGHLIPITAGDSKPGDAIALAELGALYGTGLGVARDASKARRLEICAATRGATQAGSLHTGSDSTSVRGKTKIDG